MLTKLLIYPSSPLFPLSQLLSFSLSDSLFFKPTLLQCNSKPGNPLVFFFCFRFQPRVPHCIQLTMFYRGEQKGLGKTHGAF